MENRPVEPVTERYVIKAAMWELYQASEAFHNIPENVNTDCESLWEMSTTGVTKPLVPLSLK